MLYIHIVLYFIPLVLQVIGFIPTTLTNFKIRVPIRVIQADNDCKLEMTMGFAAARVFLVVFSWLINNVHICSRVAILCYRCSRKIRFHATDCMLKHKQ